MWSSSTQYGHFRCNSAFWSAQTPTCKLHRAATVGERWLEKDKTIRTAESGLRPRFTRMVDRSLFQQPLPDSRGSVQFLRVGNSNLGSRALRGLSGLPAYRCVSAAAARLGLDFCDCR